VLIYWQERLNRRKARLKKEKELIMDFKEVGIINIFAISLYRVSE
jgi:hypothetical protein